MVRGLQLSNMKSTVQVKVPKRADYFSQGLIAVTNINTYMFGITVSKSIHDEQGHIG